MFSASPASPAARARQFAGAYHHVGVQTEVASATPHGLVALLFDGFFAAINRARGGLRNGDMTAKGQAIGHAVRIVDEGLKAALNLEEGGKLASDLSDLYGYVALRLTHANLRNDEAALDEAAALIAPLREAWAAIGEKVAPVASDI
jgi:flagellar secretion chaperone FliS